MHVLCIIERSTILQRLGAGLIVFCSDEFVQQDKRSTLNYRHSLRLRLTLEKLGSPAKLPSFIRDDLNALYCLNIENLLSHCRNVKLKSTLKYL